MTGKPEVDFGLDERSANSGSSTIPWVYLGIMIGIAVVLVFLASRE